MDLAIGQTQTKRMCLMGATLFLGVTAIVLLIVACVSMRSRRRVKAYYRGEGVRMASSIRRVNTSPGEYSVATFSRVLPGAASVRKYHSEVATSADLRPFLRRGDPLKIGPQLFTVDVDTRRPFTATSVPLDGVLEGPGADGVTLYTCDQANLPGNRYTGPRAGAIGYWGNGGAWHEGYCMEPVAHWYSPLWMGDACKQKEGPSPAQVARADEKVRAAAARASQGQGV
jgi:hypothetical protein